MSDDSGFPARKKTRLPDTVSKHILLRPGTSDVFEMLCHHQRRLVLLLVRDDAVETVSDIALRMDDSQSAKLTLVHTHLPKLAEGGYIDWDQTTGDISRGPQFREIVMFLELIERHVDELPPDWPQI